MNRRKTLLALAVVVVAATLVAYQFYAAPIRTQPPLKQITLRDLIENVSEERISQHVRTLASPELKGRLAGDVGQYMAADYIATQFRSYGLKPVGDDATYFQQFRFPFWSARAPVMLRMVAPISQEWHASRDFTVLSYSGSTNVTAQVVFVGYGITLPQKNYDDYSGMDVTGKIVLMLRHGPNDDPSWNEPYGVWTFGYKAWNAFSHGALGMVVVSNYRHSPGPLTGTLTPRGYRADFGALWAHRAIGESIVNNTGYQLRDLQSRIDQTLEPHSMPTEKVIHLQTTTIYDPERPTSNVLGAIIGSKPSLRDEVVILSAHYDHLGVGPAGEIYYGADDDASGTAAVLEAARILSFASNSAQFRRSILFAAWAAEEEGLLGSTYYTGRPVFSLSRTVAVIQLDMVGVGSGQLEVFNGRSSPSLYELIRRAGELAGLDVLPREDTGRSDHAPFAEMGVSAVMLYTAGDHPNYHTPNDTVTSINYGLLSRVTKAATVAVWSLGTTQQATITLMLTHRCAGVVLVPDRRSTFGMAPNLM